MHNYQIHIALALILIQSVQVIPKDLPMLDLHTAKLLISSQPELQIHKFMCTRAENLTMYSTVEVNPNSENHIDRDTLAKSPGRTYTMTNSCVQNIRRIKNHISKLNSHI